MLYLVLLDVELLRHRTVPLHSESVLEHLDEPAVLADHLLRQRRVDVQGYLFPRQDGGLALEGAKYLIADRLLRLDDPFPGAVGAFLRKRPEETLPHAFARHLHQAELGDLR